jgi:hypothetical protein
VRQTDRLGPQLTHRPTQLDLATLGWLSWPALSRPRRIHSGTNTEADCPEHAMTHACVRARVCVWMCVWHHRHHAASSPRPPLVRQAFPSFAVHCDCYLPMPHRFLSRNIEDGNAADRPRSAPGERLPPMAGRRGPDMAALSLRTRTRATLPSVISPGRAYSADE